MLGTSHSTSHPPVGAGFVPGSDVSGGGAAVGIGLAVMGWAAGTRVDTVTDIRELAPQNVKAVEGLNELQDTTGVSGELDVSIEAQDLTDPETVEWMAGFKKRVLEAGGFEGEDPSCLQAEICPGPALSDFLVKGEEKPTAKRIDATLGGAVALCAAAGGADRSGDRRSRASGVDLVRDPGPVAGRPAEAGGSGAG